MRIIIGAKNCGAIRPVSSPFLATIRPTSPRFIIPTPILSESGILNLQSFAVPPQPITFVKSATATSAIENQSIERLKSLKLVWSPILAKNTGPKIMYELTSIFLSMYCESLMLQRIIPATYAPVMSAIPKNSSAQYAHAKQRTRPKIGILLECGQSLSSHLKRK